MVVHTIGLTRQIKRGLSEGGNWMCEWISEGWKAVVILLLSMKGLLLDLY